MSGSTIIDDAPQPSAEVLGRAAEIEALAIRWRAITGVVPYKIFAALTPEARERLSLMSQTRAQRALAALPGTSFHPLDEIAVDTLRKKGTR